MPRQPANAQTSQNGTMTENSGSCRPTIPLNCNRSSPVTLCSAITGVPSAPNATGAVLAMSDSPDAASGEKPSPIRIAPVTATGVPNPRRALEERAETERHDQQLQAAILGDVRDALAQHVEQAALVRQLVEKDDVDDDPADRQQAIGRAVRGTGHRHRRRHAERADRDDQRGRQPGERRQMRRPSQDSQPAEQHDDRQRRQQRRESRLPRGS